MLSREATQPVFQFGWPCGAGKAIKLLRAGLQKRGRLPRGGDALLRNVIGSACGIFFGAGKPSYSPTRMPETLKRE